MRITKDTPSLPKKLPQPNAKWQTGDYAGIQEFRFHLPTGFLLLCRLWDTTPDQVLMDFMDNLSHGSHNRKHRDEAKQHLQNYILEMTYGQQRHYNMHDIKNMFTELDAIGRLWPQDAKQKMMDLHIRWQDNYYHCWFNKWYTKLRRK